MSDVDTDIEKKDEVRVSWMIEEDLDESGGKDED
jgi:hypothetical protein